MNNDEKPDYRIAGLFAVPTILIKFKHHGKYNFPAIASKDNTPAGWSMPLNTSFPNINESDDFIGLEKSVELKTDIKREIDYVFKEINISREYSINEFWYNIYHQDQGQEPHRHLGTSTPYWCGIYYNKNASPTVFSKDDGIHTVHWVPNWENSKLSLFFSNNVAIPVVDGDIVLFPPYLKHGVPKQEKINSDDKMRLTFSFNLLHTELKDNIGKIDGKGNDNRG